MVRPARWLPIVALTLALPAPAAIAADEPLESMTANQLYRAGLEAFAAGEIERSCRAFDLQLERRPADRPAMWQRGISLYYAGRLEDCAEQFESHRTENPHDAENAAWHYLCVAASKNEKQARARLFPARDARVPMMAVHRLYAGEATPEDVLAEGRRGGRSGEFYAHLYIALWHESRADHVEARRHLEQALDGPSIGHYMEIVARVHLERIRRGAQQAPAP